MPRARNRAKGFALSIHEAIKAETQKQALDQPKKQRKFFNRKTQHNGVTYDSKLEATFAEELDLARQAGEIKGWARQVEFVLEGGVKHRVDFLIFHTDGVVELVDTKGFDTQEAKNKRKQTLVRHGQKIRIEKTLRVTREV